MKHAHCMVVMCVCRWEFMQGEMTMQTNKGSSKVGSSKMYRRRLQKRLMHTKQQLYELQVKHVT